MYRFLQFRRNSLGPLAGWVFVVCLSGSAFAQKYAQIDLVSDIPGTAVVTDRTLVNAWGIANGPTSPFWVNANGTGRSNLYAKDGTPISQLRSVRIPPPHGSTETSAPTGIVFNGTSDFAISGNGVTVPSVFIFATEDGTISGWNPQVALRHAVLAVDNSGIGAIYKGLAIATTPNGSFIYAANFFNGSIEMYDTNFQLVKTFTDITLPPGYAPFNIQRIGGFLYVTFAKQDADKEDDVPGAGHGFVDIFTFQGHMVKRFASGGVLNSPWGLAMAPPSFGRFGGCLLVGNFGDGEINAYCQNGQGQFHPAGTLREDRKPLVIDGLWGIGFGNNAGSGSADVLYFAAGPDDEMNGSFGKVEFTP